MIKIRMKGMKGMKTEQGDDPKDKDFILMSIFCYSVNRIKKSCFLIFFGWLIKDPV